MASADFKRHCPQFLVIQNHNACPPRLVAKVLQTRNIDYQVVYSNYPNAFTRICPAMYKGIVVLGGYLAIWEEEKHPWLKPLQSFMQLALESDVPILGICLGAQLLAHIVGCNSYRCNKGGQYGYYKMNWTSESHDDPFCEYIRSNGLNKTMPYCHRDTFSFPQSNNSFTIQNELELNIKILGNTTAPYIAMFKVGKLHYGFQAHPECDNEHWSNWVSLHADSVTANGQNPAILQNECKMKKDEQDENGCLLLSKWFNLCGKHFIGNHQNHTKQALKHSIS
eukprot:412689_1